MEQALETYLDRVMVFANRKEPDARRVRAELEDHLQKKIADLLRRGMNHADAVFRAIEDHGTPQTVGYGLRESFPWLDVRHKGTARGVIAVGPKAVGIVALGGCVTGVFAFGGFAVGIVSVGGFSLALLLAFGGFALAPVGFAYGGFAVGLLAIGGFACGVVASGGSAVGLWVPGGGHVIRYFNPETVPQFLRLLDDYLSFSDAESQRTWWRANVVINVLMYSLLAMGLTANGVLISRETRRIRQADPRILE